MKWKTRWAPFLIFLVIFISFLYRSYYLADPDLGWHLQIGKYILSHGIPQTDPFSYTMPSYRFVDHEWLSDVVIAGIFMHFGLIPLHLLFAIIGTVTVFVLWRSNTKSYSFLFVLLLAGSLFDFVGIRMQIITWFFIAILVTILSQHTLFQKFRYILPLLFLFWSNLHGGFAIGYVLLAIWIIGTSFENKKFDKHNFVVLLLSFITTCINPYGYYLWVEVSKSLFDPTLRTLIQEWFPVIYSDSLPFWVYFAVSLVLILRYQYKFTKTELLVYLLVLTSAIASMRNIPVFLLVTYGITLRATTYLAKEAFAYPYGKDRFVKAYTFFGITAFILCLPQFIMVVSMMPRLQDIPPDGAVFYLKQHVPNGNILTPYGYGGYFILHFPERKVFIDGRMPSWRNPSAPAHESTYAMGDFVKLLVDKNAFDSMCTKYAIDTIVIPAEDMLPRPKEIFGLSTQTYPQLEKWFSNVFTFSFIVPHIRQSGWKEVYRDQSFVIVTK